MSTLKVGTIQDHSNGNDALLINNLGIVTTPARPAFRVALSADQSIPNNSATTIQFNDKSSSGLFDTQGNFSTGLYRYTPQVAGYYSLTAGMLMEHNSPMYGTIRKNGVVEFQNRAHGESGAALYPTTQVNGVIYMNGSSDYVECQVYHNAGSSQNCRGGDKSATYFCGYLIG